MSFTIREYMLALSQEICINPYDDHDNPDNCENINLPINSKLIEIR